MLFNSFEFLLFLPVVFFIYWFLLRNTLRGQNIFLLLASYLFYGWWDWRFLILIIFSTIVDYFCSLKIENQIFGSKRKVWLWVSLTINLGMLGFFKYFNFFIESWVDAWAGIGIHMSVTTLNIILPVGISFYTFQTLSYTIDVYRNQLKATKNFIDFAAFVTFFPQLVAGPIERASHLLPQFASLRTFNYEKARDGVRLMLWGFFKKIVIADSCSFFVDDIFNNHGEYSGATLVFGAVLFAFQIYGDFSGYSDIAIGVSKLFGFELMQNFRTPYFSSSISEFWKRWHISLNTWFRDYLYIPLGGSKERTIIVIRNIFIIFIVSGFWHGAKWTFIVWGTLNALYFLPDFFIKKYDLKIISEKIENKILLNTSYFLGVIYTFSATCLAWIFFRSATVEDALNYIIGIFNSESFYQIKSKATYTTNIRPLLFYIIYLFIIDWIFRKQDIVFTHRNTILRYLLYGLTAIMILLSIKNQAASFIYFQF